MIGGARFKALAAIRQGHQAARPAGDFGNAVRTETRDDRIERRHDRRQRAQQFQRLGLDPEGLLRMYWVASLVNHRARAFIAVLVPVALHGACREGIVEIVRNNLARRKIELDLGAVLGREIGKASVEQGFGSRN